jgi:cytosine/adenosine deaminase-related metal-dependent hydrolase
MHGITGRLTAVSSTLALIASGVGSTGSVAQAQSTPLAITHVTVIDIEHGRRLLDRTVLVQGNRIARVGPTAATPLAAGTRIVDGRGKYLIPGLWDMHVHALREGRSSWMFPLFIATGVTGIRDTGSPLDSLLSYRTRVGAGDLLGPRIVGTGPLLDAPDAQYSYLTDPIASAADGRRAVDSLADAGVNFIKTYNSLSRDAFFAIAAEAKLRGIPIIGHVPYKVAAFEASDAGLKSIEHLTRVVDSCLPDSAARRLDAEEAVARKRPGMTSDSIEAMLVHLNDREAAAFDERLCEQAGAHFARNSTWQVPTQARDLHWTRAFLASDTTQKDLHLRYVPATVIAFWVHYRDSVAARPFGGLMADSRYRTKSRAIRALIRGGDGLLAGTDTDGNDSNIFGVPGFTLHDEIEAFVRDVGLTPLQALRSATLGPAQFLRGTDSLGTIATGKLADLVLLDLDPLVDIRSAQRIRAVIANGRYLGRAALDSLLVAVERRSNPVNPHN